MDVKACDNCKRMNLDIDLYTLMVQREAQEGIHPTKTDPIIGFRFSSRPQRFDEVCFDDRVAQLLCKPCAEKKIADMLSII